MPMEYRYLTAPWTPQDLIGAINEMAPSMGWTSISDGSQRGMWPGAFSSKSDPTPNAQDFMTTDKARNRFLYTSGGIVYAVPVSNGVPGNSVQVLSGLPSTMWMPAVVGNTLYLARYGSTDFLTVPIAQDGSLGTPTAPGVPAPGVFYHLVAVGDRLFALAYDYYQIYEARLDSAGVVLEWVAVANLGQASPSSVPALLTDGSALLYMEPKSAGGARLWILPLTPTGIGTPSLWGSLSDSGYRTSNMAPYGGDRGLIFSPYLSGSSYVTLIRVDASGGVGQVERYSAPTPGGNAGAGAGAMMGRLFVLKYGGTLYYVNLEDTAPGTVLHAPGDVGREKFLYLRGTMGGLEAYIAEDWDPTNDIAANLTQIAGPSLNTGADLILTMAGMPTHLALLFRQGSTLPTPVFVCEVDPHLQPDGSLLYPADDGSWPLWGGVKAWDTAANGAQAMFFHTIRGPIQGEWIVMGDALGATGSTLIATAFLPAHPRAFGGPDPLTPYAKRGRLYQRESGGTYYPSPTERGLERGYLGAGDTVLFAYDTGGAVGDTVELPTGRYVIVYRGRTYTRYDLLAKVDESTEPTEAM